MDTRLIKRKIMYRTTPHPSPNLPFGVRCVGYYHVLPGFQSYVFKVDFVQIFWCQSGCGIIILDGKERELRAGQIAVYLPNMLHQWFARNNAWEIRIWTMDGLFAAPLTTAFGLTGDVYEASPVPVKMFHQLEKAIQNPSTESELHACLVAFQLLHLASQTHRRSDQLMQEIIEQINLRWTHADFNLKTLSTDFRLHTSSLSRRFRQSTGILPKDYIARLRTQQALSLIQSTNLSINDIALKCGYTDPNYLSRVIRHVTGMSPIILRHAHQPLKITQKYVCANRSKPPKKD